MSGEAENSQMNEEIKMQAEAENAPEYTPENHPNTLEYKKIQSQIAQLRQSINDKMEKMHFTDSEKKEINDIVEYYTLLKEAAKVPLIKVNENCILDEVEDKVKDNIKLVSNTMLEKLNAKMKEIIERRRQQ